MRIFITHVGRFLNDVILGDQNLASYDDAFIQAVLKDRLNLETIRSCVRNMRLPCIEKEREGLSDLTR